MSGEWKICPKMEKTQRWDDGRYGCGREAGHEGNCHAWSRSASGRQHFAGFEPCEHMKAGDKECGCILGDGINHRALALEKVLGTKKGGDEQ